MGLFDASYQYGLLQKKYHDFSVPAAKIKVGGIPLTGQKDIAVQSVEVSLSLSSAGSAYFVLDGGYDYSRHELLTKLKTLLKLGKVVEIELGYGSDTTMVFKGYLASLTYRFLEDEGISFAVTALDARRLMMTDNRPYLQYDDDNYSDMVKKIMKRYRKLCSFSCDATFDRLKSPVTQRVSDYDFITRELIGSGKTDREFFIVGDKAYFRKPHGIPTSVITLGMNMGLKSYVRSTDYLNRKIEVQGYNPKQSSVIKGSASAACLDSKEKVIMPGVTVLTDSQCTKASTAKNMAQAIADQLEWETCRTEGTCTGLPEIVPGRFMKIKDLDGKVDKKYYITQVTHTLGDEGFTTSFETEGWAR